MEKLRSILDAKNDGRRREESINGADMKMILA